MRVRAMTWLRIAAISFVLAGCATAYGPRGFTGGYSDEKVDEQTYMVSFSGNGNTTGDMVWNYWIYRCAELTKEKGFAAFSVIPANKKTSDAGDWNDAGNEAYALAPGFIKTRGARAPVYIYTPGSTVTVYGAKGIVKMYNQPFPAEAGLLLSAEVVLATRKPYMDAKGKESAPSRREILEKAVIQLPGNRV